MKNLQSIPAISDSLKRPPVRGLKILLIEDNPGDAALIREALKKSFRQENLNLKIADSLAEGVSALSKENFDLVTVDLNLPDSEGLDAVEKVRKQSPKVAMIVLTGWADREVALTALRYGAQDYLIKGSFDPESLKWSVNCAIARQKTLNQLDLFRQNEMEKNEMKDRVLSMTAHDIRGSIVGVLGFLRNILEGEFIDNLSSEQRHVFEMMHKNCEDVISLSDEIVQARRARSASFQPTPVNVDVQDFLLEVVEKCKDAALLKNIQLNVDFKTAPKTFSFDPKLISRALKNLILNAIKFSDENSQVSIFASSESNFALNFSVKDSGPGIQENDLQNIFDEFSPLKIAGSIPLSNGLGLVIVKKIVEAHKGSAWVESKINEGSEFGIRIPKAK